MSSGHQERPEQESRKAGLKSYPHATAMAEKIMMNRPPDEQQAGSQKNQRLANHHAGQQDQSGNGNYRHCVAEGNCGEGLEHRRPAVPVHAESDGKQPAHGRIEAVERTQAGERQPRP
jgi:hypothetical protein